MSAKGAIAYLKELAARSDRDQVLDYAANLAFWSLLSLFPFFIFVLTLIGYLPVRGFEEKVFAEIENVMPPAAASLIERTVNEVLGKQRGWLLIVSIVGSLWSASAGMASAVTMLNRAYEVPETRPWWKVRLLSIALTIGAAVCVIVAGISVLIGPGIVGGVFRWLHLGEAFQLVWALARWPLTIVAIDVFFAALYRFLPNVAHRRFRPLSHAALTAVGVWLVASVLFNLYVGFFNFYAKTYGALGTVIALMMWLLLGGLALAIGGEVDALERTRNGHEPHAPGHEPRSPQPHAPGRPVEAPC